MAVAFSENAKRRISETRTRYPTAQAALLPVLHIAQEEHGDLRDEVAQLVAETLGLSYAHVHGVVTFYTMYHRKRPGKNVLMVCTNVSCMLRGAYDVLAHLEKRLGVGVGETTADGQFTLIEEECLAACANAPMMICGDRYYLDLDKEKVDRALHELEGKP
jgi:NADH-quinone oxidoreductase E subunit